MWLQLYAKKHNDVGLMVEVMKLLKRNDLPYQSGTADIVFRYIIDHKRCFVLFAFPYSSYSKNFYTTMLIGWTLISEISSSYGLVGWGCDKFQVSTLTLVWWEFIQINVTVYGLSCVLPSSWERLFVPSVGSVLLSYIIDYPHIGLVWWYQAQESTFLCINMYTWRVSMCWVV